jgi:septal ring factor EnvC (AmiA/AmiB activator)
MSLARDFSEFADQMNEELDSVINNMAEQSKRVEGVEKARSETNELLARVFERMGGIEEKLTRIVPAVESFDRRLTLLQEAQVNTARDFAHRLTRLEHNGTHPTEEVTPPHPRPSLPR